MASVKIQGPSTKGNAEFGKLPRDSLGYDAEAITPLYKHIPFYIKIHRTIKQAVGFFYHNTYESVFDLGC